MREMWSEVNCPWEEAGEEYDPHGHQVPLLYSEGRTTREGSRRTRLDADDEYRE